MNTSHTVSSIARCVHASLLGVLLCAAPMSAPGGSGDDKPPLVVGGLRLINGTQLYCESIGTGIPLVIIHGGPGLDHSYLLPQMAQLADTYELIFFDQRGCGQSTANVDSASMRIDSLVEDIDRVRDAYNLNTMNLLGHSLGGLIAMRYAIRHGDRLNSLILVNSTPPTSEMRSMSLRMIRQRTSAEDSAAEAAVEQSDEYKRGDTLAVKRYFKLFLRGTFRDHMAVDDLTLSFPPDYGERRRLAAFLRSDPALQNYDILARLDTISCPVLIIGSDDDIVPRESNELIHQHIRGSKYLIMNNCGHFPFVEAARQFFPAIRDFLDRVRQQ